MSANSTTASVANKVAVISLLFKLPPTDINAFLALLCLPDIEVHSTIPNTATNIVEISHQTDLAGNEDATVVDEMENILSNNES